MSEHAKLSPSGAEKWMTCPGSAALEAGEPDSSNDYSDEGTAAHFLASECLVTNTNADGFAGQVIGIWEGKAHWFAGYEAGAPSNMFTVDGEMVTHVQSYVNNVREYANGGLLHVEQRMGIGHLTGEKDAAGTADAVVIQDGEIIVIDLKYGMREVNGERNKQLMIYALAALEKFSMYEGEFTTIRTVIIQPRIGHFPEWSCTVDELLAFGAEVRAAAVECRKAVEFNTYNAGLADMRGFLVPGDHCRKNYCKARATCPALIKLVEDSIGADFEDMTSYGSAVMQADPEPVDLGKMMDAIPLIEDWCKSIRARVESELFSGRPVPGYKLVQGKKGNRQWTSKDEAEAMLKGFKLKVEEMYDLKLVSPTTAEKLAKAGTIGPRQWPKLQGFITQSDGSPSVAPESDKRPALEIKPAVDDFDNITETDYADMI